MDAKKIISFFCFILLLLSLTSLSAGTLQKPKANLYIGIYLNDISGFDITQGRFNADFYFWCKWFGNQEAPDIRFPNGEIDTLEQVNREDDGKWHSIRWHVQGTFRGTFLLHFFPFDVQSLNIEISPEFEKGTPAPDLAGSGMAEEFSITGWVYEPFFKASIKKSAFASDFGSIGNEGIPYFSESVLFSVTLKRPMAPFTIKFLLPLVLIIIISMAVFFIPAEELEANIGVGVTTLLTCVAFQFSLADSIPDVPYLVTSDKFFIIAYLIVFINIILTVIKFNLGKKDEIIPRKMDRCAWKILGGSLMLCISIIFFTDVISPVFPSAPVAKQEIKKDEQLSSKNTLVLSVPALKNLNISNILKGLIYRGLYHEAADGASIPHLAVQVPSLTNDAVRYLQDGSAIVRWELKPGMKWGDGKPITIDDVIFSLGIVKDDNRINIVKINDRTIDVQYRKRQNYIIELFEIYPGYYFRDAFDKEGIDGVYNLVKTTPPPMDGPYILKEFVPDDFARFEANPYFAGKTPRISVIIIRKLKKGLPEVIAAGEGDLCGNLSVASYNAVKDKPGYLTQEDTAANLYLLQPDISLFPYNELEFRKAIACGIDRQKVRSLLFGDKGEVADSYRPSSAHDYTENIPRYQYNPGLAKELLTRLKIVEPLKLICSKAVSQAPEFSVVEQILADLKKTGLPVILEITDASTAALFTSGRHGGILYINRSSVFEEPDKFWNIGERKDDEKIGTMLVRDIRDIADKFNNTLFLERRLSLSEQMQQKWGESVPVISLAFGVYRSVYQEKLEGWNPGAVDDNIFWNVEEWYFR